MEYKKIGNLTNDIFGSVIGEKIENPETGEVIVDEKSLLKEDLSNFVEVGQKITDLFNNDSQAVENYTRKVIDKVGKVIFHDDKFSGGHLPIYHDSWEFGSILEKIRVDTPAAEEDYTFDLANYTGDEVFDVVLPEASEKFFNNSTTFKMKLTTPKRQIKSAFTSKGLANKFLSSIQNQMTTQLLIRMLALEYRLECNLIVEKFKGGNKLCLVNLFDEYVTATGDTTLTVDKALINQDFLRFSTMKIGMLSDFLAKPSVLYNDEGYRNISNKEDQVMLCITDLDKAFNTYLYSKNRHNEFLDKMNYHVVPYWQSGGTKDAFDVRSRINAIPASEGPAPKNGADNRKRQVRDGILAVIQDYRAVAITQENSETDSINIPDARAVNTWYFRDANYICDTDENAVVFYISNYRTHKFDEEPEDFTTGGYYTESEGTYTAVDSDTDFDPTVLYYSKIRE